MLKRRYLRLKILLLSIRIIEIIIQFQYFIRQNFYHLFQFIMEIILLTNYINFVKIIFNDNLLRNITVLTFLEIRFKIYLIYLKIA